MFGVILCLICLKDGCEGVRFSWAIFMKIVYSYAFLGLLLGVKLDILVFFSLSAAYLSSLSLLILIYYALFARLYSGSSSMTSSMEC